MKRSLLGLVLALGISSMSYAQANWDDLVPAVPGTPETFGIPGFSLTYCGGHSTPMACDVVTAMVPLTAFARASDVAALSSQVAAFQTQINQFQAQQASLNTRFERQIGLASALQIQSPGAGFTNRLGLTTAEDGTSAIGLSYIRQQGHFDIGGAFATNHGNTAGKASIGFSW